MGELVEDFNDTTYVVSFGGNWGRSTVQPHEGSGCFKSATINHGGTTNCTVTVPAGATGVQFWYRVSSEAIYDTFEFLIAGAVQQSITSSGEVPWTQSPLFTVTPGQTLTWRYSKDAIDSSGQDAAYIDDLVFFIDTPPIMPVANWAAAVTRASRF